MSHQGTHGLGGRWAVGSGGCRGGGGLASRHEGLRLRRWRHLLVLLLLVGGRAVVAALVPPRRGPIPLLLLRRLLLLVGRCNVRCGCVCESARLRCGRRRGIN